MSDSYFLSYSNVDGKAFALQLADEVASGPPPIPVWLDKRELQRAADWDEQTRALKYKKRIIPLLFHPEAEMP